MIVAVGGRSSHIRIYSIVLLLSTAVFGFLTYYWYRPLLLPPRGEVYDGPLGFWIGFPFEFVFRDLSGYAIQWGELAKELICVAFVAYFAAEIWERYLKRVRG